jgi:hypothetical protein
MNLGDALHFDKWVDSKSWDIVASAQAGKAMQNGPGVLSQEYCRSGLGHSHLNQ